MKGVKSRAKHYDGPRCPDCLQLLSLKERISARLFHGRCSTCAHMRIEREAAEQVRRMGAARARYSDG